jgi:adenylate kinase family enzyme
MSNGKPKIFAVSVATPPGAAVEYYEEINLSVFVTNKHSKAVIVDSVTVRFQSDHSTASEYVDKACGIEIQPDDVGEVLITVRPEPQYLRGSNYFDVRVDYRYKVRDSSWHQDSEIHKNVQYILIGESKTKLGQAFISFKQPETLPLANLLKRFAERGGFIPYLALHESDPGADLWKRIEPAIKNSACAFVIWTRRTDWGTGVEDEIDLCRKYNVPEILLLENGLDIPKMYKGTTIEYRRFDPENPASDFVKAISAKRQSILDKKVT